MLSPEREKSKREYSASESYRCATPLSGCFIHNSVALYVIAYLCAALCFVGCNDADSDCLAVIRRVSLSRSLSFHSITFLLFSLALALFQTLHKLI